MADRMVHRRNACRDVLARMEWLGHFVGDCTGVGVNDVRQDHAVELVARAFVRDAVADFADRLFYDGRDRIPEDVVDSIIEVMYDLAPAEVHDSNYKEAYASLQTEADDYSLGELTRVEWYRHFRAWKSETLTTPSPYITDDDEHLIEAFEQNFARGWRPKQ